MIIVFFFFFVQLAISCIKIISLLYILKLYRLSIECSFNNNTDLSNTYV